MKKIILFISLFILLFSVVALAEDDTCSSAAGVFPIDINIPDEYLDPVYLALASGDTRAVEYTTTDIYNLLSSALNGSSYLSAYSLPQIASQIRRISTILFGSGQAVPSSGNMFDNISNIMSYLRAYDSGSAVGLGTLALNMQYDITDIKNYNSNINNNVSSLVTSSSNIYSKLSSLDSLNWSSFGASFLGATSDLSTNYLSSRQINSIYAVFRLADKTNNPGVIRLSIPFRTEYTNPSSSSFSFDGVYAYNGGSYVKLPYTGNYYIESSDSGIYLYLFDFNRFLAASVPYYFHISNSSWGYFNSSGSASALSIPFDSYDYQLLNIAFSSSSLSGLDKLVDIYASPDQIAAKQAQQAVEDSVLSDFTGSGSESMSTSDVGGVKQVSGAAKQFLATGSSSSNALGLFNINGQGLWQWFSQTTADNLDTSPRTRSTSEYYFYDLNEQDYYDKLGGSYVSESY